MRKHCDQKLLCCIYLKVLDKTFAQRSQNENQICHFSLIEQNHERECVKHNRGKAKNLFKFSKISRIYFSENDFSPIFPRLLH